MTDTPTSVRPKRIRLLRDIERAAVGELKAGSYHDVDRWGGGRSFDAAVKVGPGPDDETTVWIPEGAWIAVSEAAGDEPREMTGERLRHIALDLVYATGDHRDKIDDLQRWADELEERAVAVDPTPSSEPQRRFEMEDFRCPTCNELLLVDQAQIEVTDDLLRVTKARVWKASGPAAAKRSERHTRLTGDERFAIVVDGTGAEVPRGTSTVPDPGLTNPPARQFLTWVADRFVNVYKESENVDYVRAIRRLAEAFEEPSSVSGPRLGIGRTSDRWPPAAHRHVPKPYHEPTKMTSDRRADAEASAEEWTAGPPGHGYGAECSRLGALLRDALSEADYYRGERDAWRSDARMRTLQLRNPNISPEEILARRQDLGGTVDLSTDDSKET